MKLFHIAAAALALSLSTASAHAGNVVVVLSDSDHLDLKDGRVLETGFYLNELMQPVKALLDAGHQITFATPRGTAPTLDKSSVNTMHFGEDEAAMRESSALLDKLMITSKTSSPVISLARVEQIGYDHFDAVYVPGGHAPMQDLLVSPELGRLLADFHTKGKITALACHGPIALLSTMPDAKDFVRELETSGSAKARNWIYAGYRMTVISNEEEEIAKGQLNGGAMKFYPQTALQDAGANYQSNTVPYTSYVVTDRELITGQNPASAPDVAKELLRRLK
ncbi:ThiJ/PfpI family protein [Hyphomicrobiales bacterium]|nr:ThiJ/PfpI family protein [Hyphomicrobiales bacterium]CAH1666709.1 ThiJ/PfpI family protein [Hyphomicrobiales bacterium]